MAIVRTVFSPRCCATSRTSRLPWFCVSSAFKIAGSGPSNCTSTTAPVTCLTRPTRLSLISLFPKPVHHPFKWKRFAPRRPKPDPSWRLHAHLLSARPLNLNRLRSRYDLDQLLGDHRLTRPVIFERVAIHHVTRVPGRVVHRRHLRCVETGVVLQKRAENLRR